MYAFDIHGLYACVCKKNASKYEKHSFLVFTIANQIYKLQNMYTAP